MQGKFVVTGCGRSGTTFTTHLFRQVGVDARHEEFFPYIKRRWPGVFYDRKADRHHLFGLDWGDYAAEIAWQAAPFLAWLHPSIPVVHQLRHPRRFVLSRISKGMTHADLRNRYTRIKINNRGAEAVNEAAFADKVRYLAEFWVVWNDLVEKNARGSYMRLRVEDLDPAAFGKMLDHVGVTAAPEAIDAAFATVPRDTNTRPPSGEAVDWAVLSGAARSRLEAACARYGYDPEG
ncbi:hypothetical protein [Tropicimonas sediminicola]|uniref:Sulfotransferase family protein n=1 Tax=Tropicimonas sediminicola TaxID=1031541 RepID=A0A239FM44_9RHOB|nr:hypothetical protein [Tropicimonas sediminicola]SNS57678.1 hypothetical protein SAMN05421757_102734 [Tropicimonas sediminicola]